LPTFLQNLVVDIHKDIRLFIYFFTNRRKIKRCKDIDKTILADFNKSRKYGPLNKICYAPYTSMFFSRSGLVSPCYASYNENSSHIKSSSIRDIWFEGSFNKIREQHKTCDLSKDCKFCKEIMDVGSYGSLLINKYEHYAFSKSEYPVIMEFELSNKCNLSCIMCDANLSSGIEKGLDGAITGNLHYHQKYFTELREFIPHLQLAEFTGGDPFMIDEYYQIWEMIAEINPNCHILITTNANTMNSRIEKLLESHKHINFNISIDSLQKENYETIRRNGNFELAMANINIFINYCKQNRTQVNILVCPMTVNWSEMPDFVNFANEKQICVYYHTVVKPQELSLKFLEKVELNRIISELENRSFSTKTKKEKTNNENYKNLVGLIRSWMQDNNSATISESVAMTDDQLILCLRQRIVYKFPTLLSKFESLLDRLNISEEKTKILKRLVEINDKDFFENLENKSIEELFYICINMVK